MKTHDLARALVQLAAILRAGPNVDLRDLQLPPSERQPRKQSRDAVAVNLSTLVALSRLGRQQWLGIIKEYDFPIPVNSRDSSRDLVGKVLRYLESNPDARERLAKSANQSEVRTSPELKKALQTLLGA